MQKNTIFFKRKIIGDDFDIIYLFVQIKLRKMIK